MFKSISKHNLTIIAKNATLAVAMIFSFCLGAKAKDTKPYETLQISCNPFVSSNVVECDSNSLSISESEEQIVAQSRRGRRGVRSKGKISGYYGGFNIGIGMPSGGVGFLSETVDADVDYGNGFVGSVFGGIKLSRNFSADFEFMLGLGGLDTDELNEFINSPDSGFDLPNYESDGDYSTLVVYINPRFELPLTQSDRFSLYFSPGIGIAQTNVSFNQDDDLEPERELRDFDSSNTGFAYQVKGGASYSFSRRIGVFGQLRYSSMAADEDVDDINLFSVETGLKWSF